MSNLFGLPDPEQILRDNRRQRRLARARLQAAVQANQAALAAAAGARAAAAAAALIPPPPPLPAFVGPAVLALGRPALVVSAVPGRAGNSSARDAALRRMRFTDNMARLSRCLRAQVNNPGRVPPAPSTPAPRAPPVVSPVAPNPASANDDPAHDMLIEAQADHDCTYRAAVGGPAVAGALLRMKLQVYNLHDPRLHSYVSYYCDVKLRRPAMESFEDLGGVHAYRLSKPSASQPRLDGTLWRQELLAGPLDDINYANGTVCFARALRALYNPNGTVRARIGQNFRQEFANNANGNDIVFISQLFIRDQRQDGSVSYAGNNFSGQVLDVFYRLVTGGTLPAWHNINGPATFILEPGLLRAPSRPDMSQVWGRLPGESDDAQAHRVAQTLRAVYQRRGYHVYADVATSNHGFTTMGRSIAPGDFPRQPTDRLLGGRARIVRPRGPPRTALVSPSPNRLALSRPRDDLLVTPVRPRRPRQSGSF